MFNKIANIYMGKKKLTRYHAATLADLRLARPKQLRVAWNSTLQSVLYLFEPCVLRAVVRDNRIIRGSVVRDEEGPASPVTVILVTAMEDI